MGKKYKLRPETIIDIIETVPAEKVETLMNELKETVLQAKMSFDLCKVFDPAARVTFADFVWDDDGKGEVTITHSATSGKGNVEIMKTSSVIAAETDNVETTIKQTFSPS